MVTWQIKVAMSPLSQGLWFANLGGYWLFLGCYEIRARGNWIIQVPVYFYPSLSKKYIILNIKEAAKIQRKACAYQK